MGNAASSIFSHHDLTTMVHDMSSTAAPDLERDAPTPIYQQIQDWMRFQIRSGRWPEHYKLSAETDLARDLGVSRGTVRKAIADLIAEGLLVQIHGRGTFVSSSHLEQPLAERLVAFSEDLINKHIPFETRVLEQSVIHPDQRTASLLSVSTTSDVFYLKRLRIVRGAPLILLNNYVVLSRCPGLERVDFTRYRLFEALEDLFGLKLDWGRRTFEARAADEDTARLLGISPCDPVMYLEQVVYLQDGSPIELSDVWLRGDRFRLWATVSRRGSPTRHSASQEFVATSAPERSAG